MGMICREILRLPTLQKLEPVAGMNGMNRQVRWFYVAECFDDTREIIDWLYGGELVFITGLGLKGDSETLVELVEKLNARNASGLVIYIGPYITDIPDQAAILADRLGFPVFRLPWEVKLVDVTRDLCGAIIQKEMEEKSLDNLLESILLNDSHIDEDVADRAAYYGYDLTGNCQVCIIDINNFSTFLKENGIRDEKNITDIKINLKGIVQETMLRYNLKAPMTVKSDSVIILMKVQGSNTDILKRMMGDIRKYTEKKLYGLDISAGVGNPYSEFTEMKKSFKEAEQALQISKLTGADNNICFYNELGIYSLLLNIRDTQVLEKYYHTVLDPIVKYDSMNSSELLATLEMLIRENGNITTTAEKLFIHRNTLKYRIQKIEEITEYDLRNLKDLTELGLGLMAGRILKIN